MHCLTMFRKALQDARDGKNIGTDWHDDDHWPHCMDYLLQVHILRKTFIINSIKRCS